MNADVFPRCACAGAEMGPDLRRCCHPRLTGLKLVSPTECGHCALRTLEPPAPLPIGCEPTWDCAHLGSPLGEPATARFACRHDGRGAVTRQDCGRCGDYLHPILTPQTSVSDAVVLLRDPRRGQPAGWQQWPSAQCAFAQLTDEFVDALPPPESTFHGRGIVIAGGGKYFPAAYVTVRVLREVGCKLPIELWHLAGEMPWHYQQIIAPWGVRCIDGEAVAAAEDFPLHASWWRGWQLKPLAIAHARFAEVLYLDADCYPARNPAYLFDSPQYRQHGAIFWPDLASSHCLLPPHVPPIFGVHDFCDAPAESGQLVVDKRRHWRELSLALFWNAHADFTYRLLWGDKDTYPLAWRRLGSPFARLWPAATSTRQAVLQLDENGHVLFVHRCNDKFRTPGETFASNTQWTSENDYNPALVRENFCFAVLRELRHLLAQGASA